MATKLSPVRQIDAFDTKEEAQRAMFDFAAKLREQGLTDRYRVFVKPLVCRGYAVCLKDLTVAGRAA